MIRKIVYVVYREMQKHYLTFRLLVWFKECGVTRKINYYIDRSCRKKEQRVLTEEMKTSQKFFHENRERVSKVLSLFEDEKSRQVWKAAARYRMHRTPIKSKYYSENDQYFVKEIIKPEPGEVFVDGGGVHWRHCSAVFR